MMALVPTRPERPKGAKDEVKQARRAANYVEVVAQRAPSSSENL